MVTPRRMPAVTRPDVKLAKAQCADSNGTLTPHAFRSEPPIKRLPAALRHHEHLFRSSDANITIGGNLLGARTRPRRVTSGFRLRVQAAGERQD